MLDILSQRDFARQSPVFYGHVESALFQNIHPYIQEHIMNQDF